MIYVLFAYDDYYPGGGLFDIKAVFTAADDEEACDRVPPMMVSPSRPLGGDQNFELVEIQGDGARGVKMWHCDAPWKTPEWAEVKSYP